MKSTVYTLAVLLHLLTACSPAERQSNSAPASQPTSASPSANLSPPTNQTLSETGLLKQVEDSGYPYATLTIEFPERKFSESFTINLEGVKGVTMGDLSTWVNRYVSFTYTSELTNALLDIRHHDQSLLGDDAPTLDADTRQIEGTLRGANEQTAGDEPSTIRIVSAENTTKTFDYFITKEMVAANDSVVVGYYEERTSNTIKSLKVLPK